MKLITYLYTNKTNNMAKHIIEDIKELEQDMKARNHALRWDCTLHGEDKYCIVTRRRSPNTKVSEAVAKAWIEKHGEKPNVKKIHIGLNSDLYVLIP